MTTTTTVVDNGMCWSQDNSPDKPFDTTGKWVVHIVESWEAPQSDNVTTKTIHVYTDAPGVELFVNGASQGLSLSFTTVLPWLRDSLLRTLWVTDDAKGENH